MCAYKYIYIYIYIIIFKPYICIYKLRVFLLLKNIYIFFKVFTLCTSKPFWIIPNSFWETVIFINYVSWKCTRSGSFLVKSGAFPWNIIKKNGYFFNTIWNNPKRLWVTKSKNEKEIFESLKKSKKWSFIYTYIGFENACNFRGF